ncbi:hypothetical protein FH972_009740 [Carpinus fangiana]|uniref:Uncharacterized protein n=1 Tax=Carpinus fangiana TaxID=176857 RepID=A0A660KSA3_9ROSI|nr:hypothetical protein FH972_009740 [Carpinus fangiana]
MATTRENVSHRISFRNSAQHCPGVAAPLNPPLSTQSSSGPPSATAPAHGGSHSTSSQRDH